MSRILQEAIFGCTMNPRSFINFHSFTSIRVIAIRVGGRASKVLKRSLVPEDKKLPARIEFK